MKQRSLTIRPRKNAEGAYYRHPEKTTNFWEQNKNNNILYMALLILFLAGVSVGIYFLVIKLKEGFGCGCTMKNNTQTSDEDRIMKINPITKQN
jgi:hypothetical protein